jgi:hypothetical protein
MQRNVTWQTSSEYRRLTVPSSRTLNYISFVRKIQIPEIFGFPLVYHDFPHNALLEELEDFPLQARASLRFMRSTVPPCL